MTRTQPAIALNVRRAEVDTVLITTWHVADEPSGLARVESDPEAVRALGLLTHSRFVSVDGSIVLAYGQATGEPPEVPGAVRYRLGRTVVLAEGTPACVVAATFDVDGPGRQQAIIDTIAESLTDAPGLLSANFHTSVDGGRVLNYAEWTSEEAHIAFLDGATRATTLRISNTTPGVRPIGFVRYRPEWSVDLTNI
jgi:hypothetical protein